MCGREIFMDHGLSGLNYDRHIEACPKQQMKVRRAAGRAYIKKITKAGEGDSAVPIIGQLGFPFEGVPREVGG